MRNSLISEQQNFIDDENDNSQQNQDEDNINNINIEQQINKNENIENENEKDNNQSQGGNFENYSNRLEFFEGGFTKEKYWINSDIFKPYICRFIQINKDFQDYKNSFS